MAEPDQPLTTSLQWIALRLGCFDPLPSGKPDRRGLKAFGELSILYMYALEATSSSNAERAALLFFTEECGQFLRSCCARPAFAEIARREPLLGYLCVLPYMALRSSGFRTPLLDETVAWLAQFNLPGSVETVPYRNLDRQYFLWKGGLAAGHVNWVRLLADTVLGGRRGTLYYDMQEAYSITHTLIYITDFGKKPDVLSAKLRTRTEILIESLTVHYWRLGNWDLLGELLMSVHLLRMPGNPLLSAAANALAGQLDKDGSLAASTSERREERRKRYVPAEQQVTFDPYTARRYHPTFVWVLYSLARLSAQGERR